MASVMKIKPVNILGTTKSGKYIYKQPELNIDFQKQDHLDAFKAHAVYMTYNELDKKAVETHRFAMNEHYLLAVNTL